MVLGEVRFAGWFQTVTCIEFSELSKLCFLKQKLPSTKSRVDVKLSKILMKWGSYKKVVKIVMPKAN